MKKYLFVVPLFVLKPAIGFSANCNGAYYVDPQTPTSSLFTCRNQVAVSGRYSDEDLKTSISGDTKTKTSISIYGESISSVWHLEALGHSAIFADLNSSTEKLSSEDSTRQSDVLGNVGFSFSANEFIKAGFDLALADFHRTESVPGKGADDKYSNSLVVPRIGLDVNLTPAHHIAVSYQLAQTDTSTSSVDNHSTFTASAPSRLRFNSYNQLDENLNLDLQAELFWIDAKTREEIPYHISTRTAYAVKGTYAVIPETVWANASLKYMGVGSATDSTAAISANHQISNVWEIKMGSDVKLNENFLAGLDASYGWGSLKLNESPAKLSSQAFGILGRMSYQY